MPQTTYSAAPAAGKAGLEVYADAGGSKLTGYVDEAAGIGPGLCCIRSASGDGQVRLPFAPTADADGIILSHAASGAAVTDLDDTDADGALGAGEFLLPVRLTLTLNNHADWDATTGTISYLDHDYVVQSESLAIPNGGNATLITSGYARKFVSISIPIQTSANATFTVGVSAEASLGGGDFVGVSMFAHKTLVATADANNEVFEDNEAMPIMERGVIWVECENAFVRGAVPYVRLTAGVSEQAGAFRCGDSDGGDCVPLPHARFVNSGSAGLAQLRVMAR